MKTLITLLMAVMAFPSLFAQTVSAGSRPLSHEDSLVLAELGAQNSPAGGGLSQTGLRSKTDVMLGVDSISKPQPRVLSFPTVIDAVLKDIPYNLRNITGELELAQGEFENYESMVVLPGAEKCIVTRWHSADDTTASWQAKMANYDEFGKAAHEYHELYKKLQSCYVRLVDGSIVYLNGVWEPAKESAAFTTSTLRLTTGDPRYKEVKIEIELVYLLADWAININIVSKKRDDQVGGGGVGALMQ